MQLHPAWIDAEELDTETVARISYMLAPHVFEMKISDPACVSALALEATEIFQLLHFSFDEIYWDTRDYPTTVSLFVDEIAATLRRESRWLNGRYVVGKETLADLLQRHRMSADRDT